MTATSSSIFRTATRLTLLAGAGTLGAWLWLVHQHTKATPRGTFREETAASPELSQSLVLRQRVNPQGNAVFADSYTATLRLPRRWGGEELLARFVRGFFGSWTLTPERQVLQVVRPRLVRYAGTTVQQPIWSLAELATTTLPPTDTILFGGFQVLDKHMEDSNTANPVEDTIHTSSHVDVGFGNDSGIFAGVHRFSATRLPSSDGAQGEQLVQVRLECVACNPTGPPRFWLKPLWVFHLWYASTLFRESVSELKRSA